MVHSSDLRVGTYLLHSPGTQRHARVSRLLLRSRRFTGKGLIGGFVQLSFALPGVGLFGGRCNISGEQPFSGCASRVLYTATCKCKCVKGTRESIRCKGSGHCQGYIPVAAGSRFGSVHLHAFRSGNPNIPLKSNNQTASVGLSVRTTTAGIFDDHIGTYPLRRFFTRHLAQIVLGSYQLESNCQSRTSRF